MNSVKIAINDVINLYDWALNISDQRVANWPLMQGFFPTCMLTVSYLSLVFIGIWIMKNKLAFKLKYSLLIYNFLMVLLNLYICLELFYHSWKLKYDYFCQALNSDPSNVSENKIAAAIWWFYMSKLFEFIDTIFFVLRKKNDQISFLHIYHHASMFPIWWIGVKWLPGGSAFLGPMINSFIHSLMYSYYGLSSLGTSVRKYLFWKKYLTCVQMIQFAIGMAWGLNLLISGCKHIPLWMIYAGIVYGISMISLFLNFYYRAYILKCRLYSNGNSSPKSQKILSNGHSKVN